MHADVVAVLGVRIGALAARTRIHRVIEAACVHLARVDAEHAHGAAVGQLERFAVDDPGYGDLLADRLGGGATVGAGWAATVGAAAVARVRLLAVLAEVAVSLSLVP